MWVGRVSHKPPLNRMYCKNIALEIFGWDHKELCINEAFHVPYLHLDGNGIYEEMRDNKKQAKIFSKCKFCGESTTRGHRRLCKALNIVP